MAKAVKDEFLFSYQQFCKSNSWQVTLEEESQIHFSEYMNKSKQSTITEKLELTSDFVWTTWKF